MYNMLNIIDKISLFAETIMKALPAFSDKDLTVVDDLLIEEPKEVFTAVTALKNADTANEYKQAAEDRFDGYIDTAFSALAGAYIFAQMLGLNPEQANAAVRDGFHRVCDANLAKKQPDGSVLRNALGKVMKPVGWIKPAFTDLLFPSGDISQQAKQHVANNSPKPKEVLVKKATTKKK